MYHKSNEEMKWILWVNFWAPQKQQKPSMRILLSLRSQTPDGFRENLQKWSKAQIRAYHPQWICSVSMKIKKITLLKFSAIGNGLSLRLKISKHKLQILEIKGEIFKSLISESHRQLNGGIIFDTQLRCHATLYPWDPERLTSSINISSYLFVLYE